VVRVKAQRLALGSAQWGMPYGIANSLGPPDDAELNGLLRTALGAGVHTIDTARAYGASEERIGRALHELRAGPPWRVITKLAPDVYEDGLGSQEAAERVAQSLAESRAALGQDALPVVLLHRFEHKAACGGELWRTLLVERDAGRIGSLGVSAATPEEAWTALDDSDVAVMQVASSLLDLRLYRQDFFARAAALDRKIYVRSLFLQGVAHLPPDSVPGFLDGISASLEAIRSVAADLGVSTRALYLAFARECLPAASPVLGCETAWQLGELLTDWMETRVDAARLGALLKALPTHEPQLVDPSRWPCT